MYTETKTTPESDTKVQNFPIFEPTIFKIGNRPAGGNNKNFQKFKESVETSPLFRFYQFQTFQREYRNQFFIQLVYQFSNHRYYFLHLLFKPALLIVFEFRSRPSIIITLLETISSISLYEILKTISPGVLLLSLNPKIRSI
jgi:hypothetical protein